jgi:hypothetical protein
MAQPQEGAVGLTIIYQVNTDQVNVNGDPVPRNISSFTTHDLVFKKPDGSKVVKPGAFVTDGSDGLLSYVTVAGDLVPNGSFRVQAHLVSATLDEMTETDLFHVCANV